MQFVSSLRKISLASLVLAPAFTGCGAETDATRGAALQQLCNQAPVEVLYHEDFSGPLSADARTFTDKPFKDPGHTWGVVNGKLLSDPAGVTIPDYYNQINLPPMDLTGKSNVRVRFKNKFQHTGFYALFVTDSRGRSMLREFGGQNAGYPNAQSDDIPIPDSYARAGVRLSFVLWSGGAGGPRTGIEIDDIRVLVDSEPGELVFFDNFEGDLSKWSVFNLPSNNTGHGWTAVKGNSSCFGGYAQTDPAGSTLASSNYTRMSSTYFSLVGKRSAQLTFQRTFQLPGLSDFSVFISDGENDNHRQLVGEYFTGGAAANFPGNENITIPIPASYLGLPKVNVEFLLMGADGGGYGVAIDNVAVKAQ